MDIYALNKNLVMWRWKGFLHGIVNYKPPSARMLAEFMYDKRKSLKDYKEYVKGFLAGRKVAPEIVYINQYGYMICLLCVKSLRTVKKIHLDRIKSPKRGPKRIYRADRFNKLGFIRHLMLNHKLEILNLYYSFFPLNHNEK